MPSPTSNKKSAETPASVAPVSTSRASKPKEADAATAAKATRASAPRKAPVPKKARRPDPWSPKEVPIHELVGKASDPRLAAALAARERWHGRSGRPALKSPTQAVAFARERHLVHLTIPSPLPNLIDPVVGRSCNEEERTTGQPATVLQGWQEEIDAAEELLTVRLCFERPTLVTSDLWPALAAVASPREEAARSGSFLTEEAEEALDLLDRLGVVSTGRLRQFLNLDEAAFEKVHGELESRLLVLSRGDYDEDDNPITVIERLGRWATRNQVDHTELETSRAWTFLFIAALRSAVVLWPEEIAALFPWTVVEREAAIAEAMSTGAVITYTENGSLAYVASPVPR